MGKALFNVVYNRKKKLSPNGTALVQIEVYLNAKKRYFTTNIYITPEQWDKKHGKVKNHPNAIKLNKQIADTVAKFQNYELDKLNKGHVFTLEGLSEIMNSDYNNRSFTKFWEKELKQSKLKPATKASQATTLKWLKKYRNDILFDELTFDFLTGFETFLYNQRDTKNNVGDSPLLGINTIAKYFTNIKRYINLAINKDLFDLNRYPFRKFKYKKQTTRRAYLSPKEIKRMEEINLSPEKENMRKVLDTFLFACYTGLRFSDVSSLSQDDINLEIGKECIDTRMKKTGEPIYIPLYILFDKKPIEILKKYIHPDRKFIFDDFTNQFVNRTLKELAEIAGIKKRVTFHVARHTTATYLLYKGVNITTIQKLLGHKKLQTTMIYSKVMDMTLINELSKVNYE